MRKYFFIAIGGFLGAISRVFIKNLHILNYKGDFPINTFIINITGSFILALVLTTAFEVWKFDSDIRLGIATGFLGAYTTFSTFCKETNNLLNQQQFITALIYVLFSVGIGFLFAYAGVLLARNSVSKVLKHIDKVGE